MRFGKYELGDLIARGGMAEVWAARLHGAEGFVKPVAIKRIREHISSDPEFVHLFIAEARLVAQLHHGNIVQIHDFDEVEGAYYLAMELVAGRDLRRVLIRAAERGRRLAPELGIHVAVEVAKGLMAAHEQRDDEGLPLGIVHRDLSPHNILLSYAGEVKVTDFGIAKAMAKSQAEDTGRERIRGKVPYMSPEQVRGGEVDQRSDLFALGLILFELTTGRRRYAQGGEAELVRQVSEAALPDPAEHNAAISPALNAVIRRLLAPSPADRFGSAREVLQALHGSAGARDRSLELAAFLRALFPEEAEAARRSVGLLGRSIEGAIDPQRVPSGHPEQGASGSGEATHLAAAAVTAARGRTGRLSTALVACGALLLAALAGLWAAGHLPGAGKENPVQEAPFAVLPGTGELDARASEPWVERRSVRPEAAAGALEIQSEPSGAHLVVDGVATGRRTPTRLGVTPGRHRVLVRWEDGAEVTASPEVRAGERLRLLLERTGARELAGASRRLSTTPPPGAVRDPAPGRGESSGPARDPSPGRGESPGPARDPAPGRGGSPGPGSALGEAVSLPLPKRRVQLTCHPWALVSLGEKDLGQTPVIRSLAPGSYRVTFRNPALGQSKTVSLQVLPSGGALRLDCGFGEGID